MFPICFHFPHYPSVYLTPLSPFVHCQVVYFPRLMIHGFNVVFSLSFCMLLFMLMFFLSSLGYSLVFAFAFCFCVFISQNKQLAFCCTPVLFLVILLLCLLHKYTGHSAVYTFTTTNKREHYDKQKKFFTLIN